MGAPSSRETANEAAEVRYVCAKGPCVYDGVLSLYAMVAYPSRKEWDRRTDFVRALRALEFKKLLAQGRDRTTVPPAYRQFKNEKILGQLNRGFRRIGWRLSAGSMAYSMIFSGARIPFDVPATDGRLGIQIDAPSTVNRAAEMLLADMAIRKKVPLHIYERSGASQPNIKHRIWASSLPVLHLAVVLHQNVGVIMNASNAQLHDALILLTQKQKWFGPALVMAERCRSLLPSKIPTFLPQNAVCLLPAQNLSELYLLPAQASR
jgi:hypothetical protein